MECCGKCKYYKKLGEDTFICQNDKSDGYALETMHDDCCEEFEEREV